MNRTLHILSAAALTLALAATIATAASLGITINGTVLDSDGSSSGPDWTFVPATSNLTLSGAGPFTLSGTNESGAVRVVVSNGVTCTVTLSNLTLRETDPLQCAFALETNACVSLLLAGTNTLASGTSRAGLSVPAGRTLSITNAPGDEAGALTAIGGSYAAGIGGSGITDYIANGGTVTINGGTVIATGGNYGAAGIGGSGGGGTVTINGGRVTATGSHYAAGIGGGYFGAGGAGGTVTINGGTVIATGNSRADIGPGNNGTASGTNIFTGGSICLGASTAAPAPSNGTKQVFCAVVSGFTPGEPVALEGLPEGYGVKDIFADDCGCIYLWLPNNNTYHFTANGRDCTVKIENGVGPTCITVNGEEVANGPADSTTAGWSYDAATLILTLSGAGPFTLSGTNGAGGVCVSVPAGVTNVVTLLNLTLRTGCRQCAFALETNACVSLLLAGTNTLASGSFRAGIEVAAGRTLSITNAPGDESGVLATTGGTQGAGIGGGYATDYIANGGTVTINGGRITATGGYGAAGIGGGRDGNGGTVTINGGMATAKGGDSYYGGGAGIGGGDGYYGGRDGGTMTINGGEVFATGGNYAAGIGGGAGSTFNDGSDGGAGGTVAIFGGRVTAKGGRGAAGIGGGASLEANGGAGAELIVGGGTLFVTGGTGGGAGIGGGVGYVNGSTSPNVSGWSRFTGGSIHVDGGYAAAAPSNGTARVWCVTVPDLTPNAAIVVTGLNPYGVNDLFADENGKLYLWLPNKNYIFTADSEDCAAGVADADTTATLMGHTTFSSSSAFTITPQTHSWNSTLEYSTNATDWFTFTTNGATAATNGAGEFRLYLRGTGNNRITGASDTPPWTITAAGSVACSGNIETLLDYTTVDNGGHPAMDAWCFANLFQNFTALSRTPKLPATNLADSCYFNMFNGCTGIKLNTEGPGTPWCIPLGATAATNWNLGMFTGTGGTFTGDPEIGTIYYLAAGDSAAPLFSTDSQALVFNGTALAIKIVNSQSGLWYTLYSVYDLREEIWTKVESLCATSSEFVFMMDLGTPPPPRRFFKVTATTKEP